MTDDMYLFHYLLICSFMYMKTCMGSIAWAPGPSGEVSLETSILQNWRPEWRSPLEKFMMGEGISYRKSACLERFCGALGQLLYPFDCIAKVDTMVPHLSSFFPG